MSTPDGPSTVPEARLPRPVGVGTFAPSEILRLDPKRLREPTYSDELEPRLGPSGDGLAPVLADLKLQQPARFDTIVATLKQLVPSVRNVNLHRARVDRMTQLDPQVDELGRQTQLSIIDRLVGQELRFDMPSGTDLPASVVSEGTLYLLAILTAFYSASEQTTTTNESTAASSIRHSAASENEASTRAPPALRHARRPLPHRRLLRRPTPHTRLSPGGTRELSDGALRRHDGRRPARASRRADPRRLGDVRTRLGGASAPAAQ